METEAPIILWLGAPGADDAARVGGKTAGLSRLAAQARVPPGFCLTTAAYDLGAAAAPAAPDPGAAHAALPPALHAALAAAYHTIAERTGLAEPVVAVRSSAVDEDGSAMSFAGQHDTYLNIVGLDAVVDAVVRCWGSARSPRALEYREKQGLALDQARVAVLVQQLVPADAAAVVFSANPVSGNRDEILINASWGLRADRVCLRPMHILRYVQDKFWRCALLILYCAAPLHKWGCALRLAPCASGDAHSSP